MKFLFSMTIFSVCFPTFASFVTVQYEESSHGQAKLIQEIFQESYMLPKSLIKLVSTRECREGKENYQGVQLCLKNNGQLLFIGANNLELTRKSILSFTEKLGDNYVN